MHRTNPAPKEPPESTQPARRREYLKQSDVPEFSFEEALRIPRVLAEQYGKQATRPADVALALDLLPRGRQFKGLSGAAAAYELTDAAAQAEVIGLTDLGRRVVSPMVEGDDIAAMREAFLKPRVIREFLQKYDTSTLPTDERIACNVLEALGGPASRTKATLSMIVDTAESLGLLAEVRGQSVVNLRPSGTPRLQVVPSLPAGDTEAPEQDPLLMPVDSDVESQSESNQREAPALGAPAAARNRRVFVSHGSNRQIVQHLKELLEYGEYEPSCPWNTRPPRSRCRRRCSTTCAPARRGSSTSASRGSSSTVKARSIPS